MKLVASLDVTASAICDSRVTLLFSQMKVKLWQQQSQKCWTDSAVFKSRQLSTQLLTRQLSK